MVGNETGGAGDTAWGDSDQNMVTMWDLLAGVGRPSTDTRDNSVVAGVRRALELLSQLSPRQMAVTGKNWIPYDKKSACLSCLKLVPEIWPLVLDQAYK